jgi:uncharacterized FlaG/YvyC family protein
MIEAVNSVLSNVSATRVVAEQQSSARSLSANPEKIQEAAKTPYVSPYISIDKSSNKAILQIRDSDTGDVVRQFPTEGQLKAYRTAQQFSDRQKAQSETQVREATGASPEAASVETPVVADVAAPTSTQTSAPTSTPVAHVETEA